MDFIDEQNIMRFQIGKERSQVAGLGNDGAWGGAEIDTHFPRDNLRQRRFTQTRRAKEQDMIERIAARARRFNENPQIGIDVLKDGLAKATNKNIVAEDLGYILRDENRIEEAIEAFKICEANIPTNASVYYELSELYKELGMIKEQLNYMQKYKENGGF